MSFEPEGPTCNRAPNPTFEHLLRDQFSRRHILKGGLGAAALALLSGPLSVVGSRPTRAAAAPLLGFTPVPVSKTDAVLVPPGYAAEVLYAWGDPVSTGPAFRSDASNTAAEQALQAGMHHDGLHFFPLPLGSSDSRHGLLVINHEYTDDGLLHVGGMDPWTADKVAKSQAAHGVSIIEVEFDGRHWRVLRPSTYARRITGASPVRLAGPAAAHSLLKTASDPSGRTVLGTVNNCAMGATPWGTYLTCEENVNGYFVNKSGAIPPLQRRYGISAAGSGYRWHESDERFDAARHPNESNRFGWVVEIDPFDPGSLPVKRTALRRLKHEGATVVLAPDNQVVVYMGDDERFEYIYKFVSTKAYRPQAARRENLGILDRGTLYVAKFDPDGRGEWLPPGPRSAWARRRGGVPKSGRGARQHPGGRGYRAFARRRCRSHQDGPTGVDRRPWRNPRRVLRPDQQYGPDPSRR